MAIKVLTVSMIAEAITRVQNNERIGDIAESLKVQYMTLYLALRRRGVRTSHNCGNRTRTVNKFCFADPTTDPTAAYFIGLLMADGFVSPRGSITLTLQEPDRAILDQLNHFLGGRYRIRVITRKDKGDGWNRKPAASLGFSCKQVTADLAAQGITSDKSQNGRFLDNLALNPNAWRGAIDGDGSLFHSGKLLYPGISLCGCRPLLEQYVSFVRLHCPSWNGNLRKTHHHWLLQVGVSGRHAKDIVRVLYAGTSVAIDRKARTARQIMAWEPQRIRT